MCPVTVPLSKPITSITGAQIHAVDVPANTDILIGVQECNVDVETWGKDAEEWKPERWIGKRVEEVASQKLPGVFSGM